MSSMTGQSISNLQCESAYTIPSISLASQHQPAADDADRREQSNMIFLGLGGNMPSQRFGPPRATLEAALVALAQRGVQISRRSRWYRSQPLPDDGQPWYVNGVSEIATTLPPGGLLALLLEIERKFGLERRKR